MLGVAEKVNYKTGGDSNADSKRNTEERAFYAKVANWLRRMAVRMSCTSPQAAAGGSTGG